MVTVEQSAKHRAIQIAMIQAAAISLQQRPQCFPEMVFPVEDKPVGVDIRERFKLLGIEALQQPQCEPAKTMAGLNLADDSAQDQPIGRIPEGRSGRISIAH